MPDDGKSLLEAAKTGDGQAFEEIMREYSPLVYSAAVRILRNASDADDVAQATFLVFWQKRQKLGSNTILAAWLYRTAVFIARNHQRSISRRKTREENAMKAQIEDDTATQNENELTPELDAAMGDLPSRYRNVLVLHYLSGLTLVQVAGQLEVPQGTAATWLTRGRDLLRARLANRGVVMTSVALVSLLARQTAEATVPPALVSSVTSAAAAMTAPATGSASVAIALAKDTLKALFFTKLKIAAGVAAVSITLVTVPTVISRQTPGESAQDPQPPAPATATTEKDPANWRTHHEMGCDPLFSAETLWKLAPRAASLPSSSASVTMFTRGSGRYPAFDTEMAPLTKWVLVWPYNQRGPGGFPDIELGDPIDVGSFVMAISAAGDHVPKKEEIRTLKPGEKYSESVRIGFPGSGPKNGFGRLPPLAPGEKLNLRPEIDSLESAECVNSIRLIDHAKDVVTIKDNLRDGASVTRAQVLPYIDEKERAFDCPSGGKYTLGRIGESPRCTIHGGYKQVPVKTPAPGQPGRATHRTLGTMKRLIRQGGICEVSRVGQGPSLRKDVIAWGPVTDGARVGIYPSSISLVKERSFRVTLWYENVGDYPITLRAHPFPGVSLTSLKGTKGTETFSLKYFESESAYASILRSDHIQRVDCLSGADGYGAGRIAFKAENDGKRLFKGQVEVVAQKVKGLWRIVGFHLPKTGTFLQLNDKDQWARTAHPPREFTDVLGRMRAALPPRPQSL